MATETGAAGMEQHGAEHGGHATVGTYVLIGVILTVITAIEVAIFYIPALAGILVPALLVLSATKFVIVVMFYMHLRYDSRIFSRVFFGPMLLAFVVVIGLILLFKVAPGFDPY